MKIVDTISVNPGKTAMGHVETPSPILRKSVLNKDVTNHVDFVNMIFPASRSGISEFRRFDVPLRTLFATILIVTGISMLTTPYGVHDLAFAICTLVFGALLAIGLLTRPVMLGAAIFYCIAGALELRLGVQDMVVFSLMFGCLIFAVVGAGKYSCDTILRNAIERYKRAMKEKKKENLMSYKAFHQIDF